MIDASTPCKWKIDEPDRQGTDQLAAQQAAAREAYSGTVAQTCESTSVEILTNRLQDDIISMHDVARIDSLT